MNDLTEAQRERLAMLAEEAGEVIQIVGKILRHGYNSTHPNGGPDNRNLLEKETGDFFAVAEAMRLAKDFDPSVDAYRRWCDKLRYTHHQGPRVGTDVGNSVGRKPLARAR